MEIGRDGKTRKLCETNLGCGRFLTTCGPSLDRNFPEMPEFCWRAARNREKKKKTTRFDLSIYDDAMWLMQLVENLLSITRIENGASMKPAAGASASFWKRSFGDAMEHLDCGRRSGHEITAQPSRRKITGGGAWMPG
ncbi:MAG: hypothetical protein ACLRPV_11550 [Lacrimispora saccharolytica]